MKNWSKLLGLTLSAALLTGTLAGCTEGSGGKAGEGTPTPTATVEGATPLVATEDVVKKLTGTSGDTVMFTVDGEPVTAEQFYYWIGVAAEDQAYLNFGSTEEIDWTLEQDGKSLADLILEDAKQAAQLYRIVETETAKAGVTLTAEDSATLEAQYAQTINQYGEEEYGRLLQQMAISDAGLRHMMQVSYLHTPLQASLFGDEGKTPPTSEVIIALAEEEGLMLAKHILIKTVDDSGSPLAEEALAAAKTQAEDLLSQLQAAADPDARLKLFDELMEEYSQDGRGTDGKLSSPDGYLFTTGQMVQAFEDGTLALEYNEMSGLVETEYGYHIILRLPPDNADMRTEWASTQMSEMTDGWMKAAVVVDSAEMDKVDVKDFYEKLVAYRISLEPVVEETPTPTPSAGQ